MNKICIYVVRKNYVAKISGMGVSVCLSNCFTTPGSVSGFLVVLLCLLYLARARSPISRSELTVNINQPAKSSEQQQRQHIYYTILCSIIVVIITHTNSHSVPRNLRTSLLGSVAYMQVYGPLYTGYDARAY